MSLSATLINFILILGLFTVAVVTVFLFRFHILSKHLLMREKEMIRRMYQLSILRELGQRIGYSLKIDQIVEIIAGSLRRLLDYSTVSYMLLSPTADGKTKIAFNISLEKSVNKKFMENVKSKMLDSLNAILNSNYTVEDVEETVTGTITDPTSTETIGSFFNVPIVIGGSPVGLLNIADSVPGRYKDEKEVEVLYTIMSQASDAVTKLEHVLKVEKHKLNSMVGSMAEGVLMTDTQKQLTVINSAAKNMLGLEGERITIFDVLDVLSNQIDLRTKLEESVMEDKLIEIPAIVLNNRFLEILISPVKDKAKNFLGVVVLLHDITKEKELEKMRDDFTNMMVHELRSPLTGIRSIASLLTNDKVKSDQNKYAEFIRLISTNSQDMLGLVNDLLDVAKLESGKFQILKKQSNITKIVEERVASFKPLAEQGNISLNFKCGKGVPETIELDEHKISQVLNNFISNAVKFTGAGGKILVSAFILPAEKDLAREIVEQGLVWPGLKSGLNFKTNQLLVAVTDTGVGISQDNISKLFNKFVQLENAARSEKKGTGLGLVIAKGIIEAHNGYIGVYSEEGEGATFFFALPLQ